jgi:hypothetical protein
VSITKRCEGRALRLLDALTKALEARGHRVEAKARGDGASTPELLAFVLGNDFTIEIEEKLARKPHILTRDEQKKRDRWN